MNNLRINLCNDEIYLLVQLINEVCNGIYVQDYVSLFGCDRSTICKIGADIQVHEHESTKEFSFSRKEINILIDVVNKTLSDIEDWEFQTRTGSMKYDAIGLESKLQKLVEKNNTE